MTALAQSALANHGGERWHTFPCAQLRAKIEASSLRVEVWEKRRANLIVVAFGGTVFKSGKDWRSNLRWILPKHADEYTEIVQVIGPAFEREFLSRTHVAGQGRPKSVVLHATGHSLGGGLA
ncbi:hypothetical protein PSP20601_05428 [Pandoraea sputorum]|nr:hypothetical protein PSP20601_05428 [Pandoraea sputorum]